MPPKVEKIKLSKVTKKQQASGDPQHDLTRLATKLTFKGKTHEDVFNVPYHTDTQNVKYILLLKKYYIAEAELQKRLNEGGDRKALEDQYRKDFNDGSFLWDGSTASNGGSVARCPSSKASDKIPDIICPGGNVEMQKERWYDLVKAISPNHQRERTGSGKEMIANFRFTKPKAGAQKLRIAVRPGENAKTLSKDEWQSCFVKAFADTKSGGGGGEDAYTVTYLESNEEFPHGHHFVKAGENIFKLYDTYIHYDDLVALNKAHLEELGFASSNPDMLWQPYPTAAQADAVDKKLAEKEKKRQEKEEQARKAGKAGKPLAEPLFEIPSVKRQVPDKDSELDQFYEVNFATIGSKIGVPRGKTQNAVMNDVGAPAIAKIIWGGKPSGGVSSMAIQPQDDDSDDDQQVPLAMPDDDVGTLLRQSGVNNFSLKAEWLHLMAHSFGGIAPEKDHSDPQVPLNLVFGTFDANTDMIRAEAMARQIMAVEDQLLKYIRKYLPKLDTSAQAPSTTLNHGTQAQTQPVGTSMQLETDTTARGELIGNPNDPKVNLTVSRVRGPTARSKLFRVTINGDSISLNHSDPVVQWWEDRAYEHPNVRSWFSPALNYHVAVENTRIIRGVDYEQLFDVFSLRRALLLEYYLDRHVLNLLALKKAQELVASQNLIFSVESWDTILKDPKKTIALKPVSGTALIGKRGAEKDLVDVKDTKPKPRK